MTRRPPRRSMRRPTKVEVALDTRRPTVKPAEHEALAPAGVGGDGLAKHAQRVERGAPGDDLRDAEREDGGGGGMAHESAQRGRRLSLPAAPACCARARRASCPARGTVARIAAWRILSTGRRAPATRYSRAGGLPLERPQGRGGEPALRAGGALRAGRHQRRRGGGAGCGPAAAGPRRRRRRATRRRWPRHWAASRGRS